MSRLAALSKEAYFHCVTSVSEPLSAQDMQEIGSLDKNCRLIKGHVFLWKDGQTWEDLWDTNGAITPP